MCWLCGCGCPCVHWKEWHLFDFFVFGGTKPNPFLTQMNGAELPSGCILQVEPADSSYQQNNNNNMSAYGPGAVAAAAIKKEAEKVVEPVVKEGDGDDNDSTGDLDDFFESLE